LLRSDCRRIVSSSSKIEFVSESLEDESGLRLLVCLDGVGTIFKK